MELVLSNGFFEMTQDEGLMIEGGGATQVAQAFFGIVLISISPAIGVGASIISTPVGGVVAAGGCAGLGLSLLGKATH